MLAGYHPRYNSRRDYQAGKAPVQTGWPRLRPSLDEALAWHIAGGWIGLVVPSGCVALDIDTPSGIAWFERNLNPAWSVQKTPNGVHLLVALNDVEGITGATHMCNAGFKITYRTDRNMIAVAPSPGREWLSLHDVLVPIPYELQPEPRMYAIPASATVGAAVTASGAPSHQVDCTLRAIRKLFMAPVGEKHFGRLNGGLLLGGLIGAGSLAQDDPLVPELISVGVENSNTPYKAEKTIWWGIERGMQRPIGQNQEGSGR
ncbi:MAG: hypothetical protein CVU59_01465 [Deltaproteobacteria bacterium HGW-Deltaproteobacteria-17]|nr:MAG: hypothetical protein CVU59_01465 [Deltaproteobacteria bacterium HGW-Deltaproteobacteria-17]